MFENNEDTPGWKAAESVAYCGSCFNQKMERRSNQSIITKSQDDEAFSENNATPRKSPSSTDSAEENTKGYLLSKGLGSCWFAS